MARQRRLSIRRTPYRLRSQAKCIKMLLQQYRYRTTIAIVMAFHIICLRRQVRRRHTFLVLTLLLLKYYCIKTVIYRHRHWSGNNVLTFNSLDINDCWHKLRFKRQHLWRLSEVLRLTGQLQLDNGSYTNNEEMLIILMARLSTASTGSWIKLECEYKIEYSRMSRVFKVRLQSVLPSHSLW